VIVCFAHFVSFAVYFPEFHLRGPGLRLIPVAPPKETAGKETGVHRWRSPRCWNWQQRTCCSHADLRPKDLHWKRTGRHQHWPHSTQLWICTMKNQPSCVKSKARPYPRRCAVCG